jgi:hypothetical protein
MGTMKCARGGARTCRARVELVVPLTNGLIRGGVVKRERRPMANEDQWIKLLEAVRGPLPEAYIAMGELVKTNKDVRWNAVDVPEGQPFARIPIYGDELGEVSVVYFRGPSVTMPHRWPGARVFHALLDGDLNQRSWAAVEGVTQATGERRVTAPDLLFSPRGDTYSFASPEGAICIVVHSSPRCGLQIDDLVGRRTVTIADGGEPNWPPADDDLVASVGWPEPAP